MTASVRLSLGVLRSNARSLNSRAAGHGLVWQPRLPGGTPEAAMRVLAETAVSGVLVDDLPTAEQAATAGIRSVWLREPPMTDAEFASLERVAARTRLTVLVDHFVHAESLSLRSIAADRGPRALISLSAENGFGGIRPGRDAADLAVAVTQQTRLPVAGVILPGNDRGGATDRDEPPELSLAESSALRGTVAACQRRGVTCPVVASNRPAPSLRPRERSDITHLTDADALFRGTTGDAVSGDHLLPPALTASGPVVSRPSLQDAVIALGHDHLGLGDRPPVALSTAGIRVERLGSIRLAVRLEGAARDLTIGDRVEFAVCATEAAFRRAVLVD